MGLRRTEDAEEELNYTNVTYELESHSDNDKASNKLFNTKPFVSYSVSYGLDSWTQGLL